MQGLKRDPEAIVQLSQIQQPTRGSKLVLGHCHRTMENFFLSLETFRSIKDYEKDKAALIGMAYCFEAMGDFKNAIASFCKIKGREKDAGICLGMALCYEKIGDHEQAWDHYQSAVKASPMYSKAHFELCRYALASRHPDAKTIIRKAIKTFPTNPIPYLFKAQYFNQIGDSFCALYALKQLIIRGPMDTKQAYLALIQHFLSQGEQQKAKLFAKEASQAFPREPSFKKSIGFLMKKAAFVRCWGNGYVDAEKDYPLKLALPEGLQNILTSLHGSGGEPFLFGRIVHRLLNQDPLQKLSEVEILFHKKNDRPLPSAFHKEPLLPCCSYAEHNKYLSLDCYALPATENLFSKKHYGRHQAFTLILYVDRFGNVIDPTGKGLYDFKNKILRTVLPPKQSFQQDPAQLLWALRWMAQGFNPTPDCENAIRNWDPSCMGQGNIKRLLFTLLGKIINDLKEEQKESYLQCMRAYGLMQKMFPTLEIRENLRLVFDLESGHHRKHKFENIGFTLFSRKDNRPIKQPTPAVPTP